jgi:hypothetical protein
MAMTPSELGSVLRMKREAERVLRHLPRLEPESVRMVREIHDQMREVTESPLLKVLKEQQAQVDVLTGSYGLRSITEEAEAVRVMMQPLAGEMAEVAERGRLAVQSLLDQLGATRLTAQLRSVTASGGFETLLKGFDKQFAAVSQIAESPEFRRWVDETSQSSSSVGRLLVQLASLGAREDELSADEKLSAAPATTAVPREAVLRAGVRIHVELILAVLFFVIQQYQHLESGRVAEETREAVFALIETVDQMRQDLDPQLQAAVEEHVVVVRRLNLRAAPERQAKRLGVLAPGQKIKVRVRVDGWLEVEYFDDERAKVVVGWVPERYTKPVRPN